MKVLLVVPALALLQLVCPGSAKSVHPPGRLTTMSMLPAISMLQEMHAIAKNNATLPAHLRNATVPMMENCDKKTFCEVQQVLLEFADKEKIEKLWRSVVNYNNHTKKNCADGKLKIKNKNKIVTFELQDLFHFFIGCIGEEIFAIPMDR